MTRLMGLPVSLYTFKVRLACAVMGIDVPLGEPDGGSYRSPAFRTLVPPGTIPALLADGLVLTESDAVIEYLDETAGGSRLMHGSPGRRARIRMISRLVDLRLEAGVRALFGHVAPSARDEAHVAHTRTQVVDALGVVEWALDPLGPFAVDGKITIADCGIAATSTWLGALQPLLLPGLATGPRFQRVVHALRADAVTAAHVAEYQSLVDAWISAKLA